MALYVPTLGEVTVNNERAIQSYSQERLSMDLDLYGATAESLGQNSADLYSALRPLFTRIFRLASDPVRTWRGSVGFGKGHLLEVGALRSQRVIEALLTVAPERYLSADVSRAFLKFPYQSPPLGEASPHPEVTSFYVLALGLEALAPCEGDLMLDALASRGYVSALLREAVGREGRVLSLSPPGPSLGVSPISKSSRRKNQTTRPLSPSSRRSLSLSLLCVRARAPRSRASRRSTSTTARSPRCSSRARPRAASCSS